MGGRHAKPIELHLAERNKNRLTKTQIEHRKNSEIKLGDKTFKVTTAVKNDAVAYKKWKELIKLYVDIEFVTTPDIGLIEKYCLAHSEYHKLREVKEIEFQKFADNLIAFDEYNKIETAVNKKMEILIKMEDRLFLNPVSRLKNVPRKEPEKTNPLGGFGDI